MIPAWKEREKPTIIGESSRIALRISDRSELLMWRDLLRPPLRRQLCRGVKICGHVKMQHTLNQLRALLDRSAVNSYTCNERYSGEKNTSFNTTSNNKWNKTSRTKRTIEGRQGTDRNGEKKKSKIPCFPLKTVPHFLSLLAIYLHIIYIQLCFSFHSTRSSIWAFVFHLISYSSGEVKLKKKSKLTKDNNSSYSAPRSSMQYAHSTPTLHLSCRAAMILVSIFKIARSSYVHRLQLVRFDSVQCMFGLMCMFVCVRAQISELSLHFDEINVHAFRTHSNIHSIGWSNGVSARNKKHLGISVSLETRKAEMEMKTSRKLAKKKCNQADCCEVLSQL